MLSLCGDVGLWSTHIICLSVLVWVPEKVSSKATSHRRRSTCTHAFCGSCRPKRGDPWTRMVVAHAVPSEVQSTAGSEWYLHSGSVASQDGRRGHTIGAAGEPSRSDSART